MVPASAPRSKPSARRETTAGGEPAAGRKPAATETGGAPSRRTFDKETGTEIWETDLPAQFYAAPITYMANGKQYIALAIGGADVPERLVALTLP